MKKFLYRFVVVICLVEFIFVPNSFAAEKQYTQDEEELKTMYELKSMMDTILDNYVGGKVTREELTEAAIKGMFNKLDDYSTYFTKEEYAQFIESVSGEFVGVGIKIEKKDNFVSVVEVLEKTPAERAQIMPGDMITKIDNLDVSDMTLDMVLAKIKGVAGTKVKLTIKRGDETLNKDIERDIIQINPIKVKRMQELFPNSSEREKKYIRYIAISEFNSVVANEFKKAIDDMKEKHVKGIIIDLRNNPGGYLEQVIRICQQIVPEGPIVHTIDKQGTQVTYSSELKKAPFSLVVLVNGNSASASEIMAGAIKDSGVGILVGEKTFGKGVVQKLLQDIYGNYFKLTIEEYLTRNGTHINKIGIEPDIVIEIPDFVNSVKGKYKLGDNVPEVEQIEKILLFLGYNIKNVDQSYDQGTADAISKFQVDNGLFPYGVADYTTQKCLNTRLYEKVKTEDKQLEGAFEIIKKKVFGN